MCFDFWLELNHMIIFLRSLLNLVLLGVTSCNLINTHHYIRLDHNISIKIEREVQEFVDNLYQEESQEEL